MRKKTRKLAKSLVKGAAAVGRIPIAAGAAICYLANDLLEEAVEAYDKLGTEIEIKLETLDRED